MPPERLAVELQSQLGPSLSGKGYRLVGQGPSGVAWRREMSGRLTAGLIALCVFALGALSSGSAFSILVGLVSLLAAGLLLFLRRPATITISLSRTQGGTQIDVSGGRDAGHAERLAATVAGRGGFPLPAQGTDTARMCWHCETPTTGNFCSACGAAQTRTCSVCETPGLTSDFCPDCGSATYAPVPPF